MPYPFTASITWDQMIEQLHGLNVQFVERMAGKDGKTKIQYFSHEVDGVTLVHPVDIQDRSERLLPSVVRGIAEGLNINTTIFGLDLG
jgi:hypothetical protein